MKLLQSKKGEIGTEEYWYKQLDVFWQGLGSVNDPRRPVKRPADAWERMVRILKIEEVAGN